MCSPNKCASRSLIFHYTVHDDSPVTAYVLSNFMQEVITFIALLHFTSLDGSQDDVTLWQVESSSFFFLLHFLGFSKLSCFDPSLLPAFAQCEFKSSLYVACGLLLRDDLKGATGKQACTIWFLW